MSVSDVCSCRAITPGAPLNAQRKATLIGSPPGRCTSATRCVLVPLLRLPSPVAQTFCTAPASRELGGRLFAYTGMFAPLLTQLRSTVPEPAHTPALELRCGRENPGGIGLKALRRNVRNSCERARGQP